MLSDSVASGAFSARLCKRSPPGRLNSPGSVPRIRADYLDFPKTPAKVLEGGRSTGQLMANGAC
jgi:hypothetical protein